MGESKLLLALFCNKILTKSEQGVVVVVISWRSGCVTLTVTLQLYRGGECARQVTWFNPPFNAAVTTDIGKQFLKLVDKHFHKNHPLGRLLNRNTVKISYSCTKNIKSIISSHNAKVMIADEQEPPREGKK